MNFDEGMVTRDISQGSKDVSQLLLETERMCVHQLLSFESRLRGEEEELTEGIQCRRAVSAGGADEADQLDFGHRLHCATAHREREVRHSRLGTSQRE